jgi:hypothetical protein
MEDWSSTEEELEKAQQHQALKQTLLRLQNICRGDFPLRPAQQKLFSLDAAHRPHYETLTEPERKRDDK